jgi:hypothetical protein
MGSRSEVEESKEQRVQCALHEEFFAMCRRTILVGNLVLLAVMLIAPPSPSMAQQNRVLPSPDGLVVVLPPTKHKERLDIQAVKNPFISGVAVQINWRDLEPMKGQPVGLDWMPSLRPPNKKKNGCSSLSSPFFCSWLGQRRCRDRSVCHTVWTRQRNC